MAAKPQSAQSTQRKSAGPWRSGVGPHWLGSPRRERGHEAGEKKQLSLSRAVREGEPRLTAAGRAVGGVCPENGAWSAWSLGRRCG